MQYLLYLLQLKATHQGSTGRVYIKKKAPFILFSPLDGIGVCAKCCYRLAEIILKIVLFELIAGFSLIFRTCIFGYQTMSTVRTLMT